MPTRTTCSSYPRVHLSRPWLALCGVATSACFMLVDNEAKQCRKDRDCEKRGGVFEGLVCTRDHICGREPCEAHSECASHYGKGAYCRPDGTCGDLYANSSCMGVLPEKVVNDDGTLKDEDLLLVGFMAPLEGNSYGLPLKQGAELALKEIYDYGVRSRRLAMLVCDERADSEAVPVAKHLIDELQVQAILGPGYSGATRAVAGETGVTQTASVLTLSASATNPDFEKWRDDGLFWRTVPSDSLQAPAVTLLTMAIEEHMREQGELAQGEKARVALIWRDNAWGNGMQAVVHARLLELSIAPTAYARYSMTNDWEATAAPVAEEQPHIVIGLGNEEFVNVIEALETLMADNPPRYVVPESLRLQELADLVERKANLRSRILGTAPGGRRQAYDAYAGFRGRFQATYGPAEPGNLAEFAYDAAYLLSFSALRTKEEYPSGRELAKALGEMSCKEAGAEVISATEYVRSAQVVAEEPCVDFKGASGEVDFSASGETSADMQIWCPHSTRSGVDLDQAPGDAFYYDVATQTLQGKLSFCP